MRKKNKNNKNNKYTSDKNIHVYIGKINGFTLNHNKKKLQIYFFYVKHLVKWTFRKILKGE